ncbi:hypothetical protein F4604DRAFT_832625 [Suillus subluteus]|nr:hypothetical protein F4604DRAFT_832625 [Suillus subluteus]
MQLKPSRLRNCMPPFPSRLRNCMLPFPPPLHLSSSLLQLQILILIRRLQTLIAGLVSGTLSVAPLLSIPTSLIFTTISYFLYVISYVEIIQWRHNFVYRILYWDLVWSPVHKPRNLLPRNDSPYIW